MQTDQRVGDRHELKLVSTLLPRGPLNSQGNLRRDQIHDAQIARLIRTTADFVGQIEHTKSSITDRDWIADEGFRLVTTFRRVCLAQLVERSHQWQSLAEH